MLIMADFIPRQNTKEHEHPPRRCSGDNANELNLNDRKNGNENENETENGNSNWNVMPVVWLFLLSRARTLAPQLSDFYTFMRNAAYA